MSGFIINILLSVINRIGIYEFYYTQKRVEFTQVAKVSAELFLFLLFPLLLDILVEFVFISVFSHT